jgi:hypothetical protein
MGMKSIPENKLLFWLGIGSISLAGVILIVSIWDGFFRLGAKIQVLDVPGFHVLDLDTPGVYAGVYQHTGQAPVPVDFLSKLSVSVVSKDTYQDIPVLMNSTGQPVSRMGFKGMVVFNFLIEQPGFYTMSLVGAEAASGFASSIILIPQAADPKPALLAGLFFFVVFLGLGIWTLLKSRRAAALFPSSKN